VDKEQLRHVAEELRRRYTPPTPTMRPHTYTSHEAINALADAIDIEADNTPT
jgi:hypothetical protein